MSILLYCICRVPLPQRPPTTKAVLTMAAVAPQATVATTAATTAATMAATTEAGQAGTSPGKGRLATGSHGGDPIDSVQLHATALQAAYIQRMQQVHWLCCLQPTLLLPQRHNSVCMPGISWLSHAADVQLLSRSCCLNLCAFRDTRGKHFTRRLLLFLPAVGGWARDGRAWLMGLSDLCRVYSAACQKPNPCYWWWARVLPWLFCQIHSASFAIGWLATCMKNVIRCNVKCCMDLVVVLCFVMPSPGIP